MRSARRASARALLERGLATRATPPHGAPPPPPAGRSLLAYNWNDTARALPTAECENALTKSSPPSDFSPPVLVTIFGRVAGDPFRPPQVRLVCRGHPPACLHDRSSCRSAPWYFRLVATALYFDTTVRSNLSPAPSPSPLCKLPEKPCQRTQSRSSDCRGSISHASRPPPTQGPPGPFHRPAKHDDVLVIAGITPKDGAYLHFVPLLPHFHPANSFLRTTPTPLSCRSRSSPTSKTMRRTAMVSANTL